MANDQPVKLSITSAAFDQEGNIPLKYSCEGEEINPPLDIKAIPPGTQSLAIIVEDPDTSKGTFDHWIAYNIPVTDNIEENSAPGVSGRNGAGKTGYHGPCPPTGSHRYFFNVYALDNQPDLPAGADKSALQAAMTNHILAQGTLMGRYQKSK